MDEFHGQVPGRLRERLRGSLSGHHPLFEVEDIRSALRDAQTVLDERSAKQVADALLVLARDGFGSARNHVDGLQPRTRDALIRVYFAMLERAEAMERRARLYAE